MSCHTSDILNEAVNMYLAGAKVDECRRIVDPPITTYTFYKHLKTSAGFLRGKVSRKSRVKESDLLHCSNCKQKKEAKLFSKHKQTVSGYDTSACKACKKSKVDWAKVSPEKRIYNRTKSRAKEKGIPFNLELQDIVIPSVCPIFGIALEVGNTDSAPSIDRKDPLLGYTKGNVHIISNKANRIKNNANIDEIRLLLEWMEANV